jgi:ATP phosphoribosyltransferase
VTGRLRLAVPNKGRLLEPTERLLRDAGLVFERGDRSLTVPVRNVAIDLLFVRTEDIVEMVADRVAGAGIAGLDLSGEAGAELEVIAELGYGRCRLTAAVPQESPVTSIGELDGRRVATAHPRLTARLLAERGVDATVIPLRGSVEVAPKLDVADAIVDLVSSGSTMLVNGLRPVATLLDSQAVLLAPPGHGQAVAQVATMLRAVAAGRTRRYLMMNAPGHAVDRISALIPGLRAPSVIPLAHDGAVAVHSVVDADDLWHVLPELEAAGATGILVLPVEQLID